MWTYIFTCLQITTSQIAESYDKCMFDYVRNCETIPRRLTPFAFSQAMCEYSRYSAFSPVVSIVNFSSFSYFILATLIDASGCY